MKNIRTFPSDWTPFDKARKTIVHEHNNASAIGHSTPPKLSIPFDSLRTLLLKIYNFNLKFNEVWKNFTN